MLPRLCVSAMDAQQTSGPNRSRARKGDIASSVPTDAFPPLYSSRKGAGEEEDCNIDGFEDREGGPRPLRVLDEGAATAQTSTQQETPVENYPVLTTPTRPAAPFNDGAEKLRPRRSSEIEHVHRPFAGNPPIPPDLESSEEDEEFDASRPVIIRRADIGGQFEKGNFLEGEHGTSRFDEESSSATRQQNDGEAALVVGEAAVRNTSAATGTTPNDNMDETAKRIMKLANGSDLRRSALSPPGSSGSGASSSGVGRGGAPPGSSPGASARRSPSAHFRSEAESSKRSLTLTLKQLQQQYPKFLPKKHFWDPLELIVSQWATAILPILNASYTAFARGVARKHGIGANAAKEKDREDAVR